MGPVNQRWRSHSSKIIGHIITTEDVTAVCEGEGHILWGGNSFTVVSLGENPGA